MLILPELSSICKFFDAKFTVGLDRIITLTFPL